jgi:hypothetical protein
VLLKRFLLEGDGAGRDGLKALLSDGGRSQPSFDVLLAKRRSFRERSEAAIDVFAGSLARAGGDLFKSLRRSLGGAGGGLRCGSPRVGLLFGAVPARVLFLTAPGDANLSPYMLCCTCEVNHFCCTAQ